MQFGTAYFDKGLPRYRGALPNNVEFFRYAGDIEYRDFFIEPSGIGTSCLVIESGFYGIGRKVTHNGMYRTATAHFFMRKYIGDLLPLSELIQTDAITHRQLTAPCPNLDDVNWYENTHLCDLAGNKDEHGFYLGKYDSEGNVVQIVNKLDKILETRQLYFDLLKVVPIDDEEPLSLMI